MPTAPPVEITIQGRVTGPEDEPLPETSVDFYPRDPSLNPWTHSTSGWTDSTGTYSVSLSTGTYEVRIDPRAGGLLTHIGRVTFTRFSKRYDHAFHGYRVSGTLRDPSGGVVDSGTVAAISLSADPPRHAVAHVDDGTYSLVLPEGPYEFEARGHHWSGLPPLRKSTVSVRSDTTVDMDFTGIEVTGTVLGQDGVPLEEVVVEAAGGSIPVQKRTGPDGRYRLWVEPGIYFFRFWPWYGGIVPRTTDAMEISGPTHVDGDLSGVEWTGTVLWRSALEPVAEAWVTGYVVDSDPWLGASDQTDASGVFRLILEPNRRYNMRVSHENALPFELPGTERVHADTTFEILLDPAPGP
jgi:hypothetical protein